MKVLTLNMHKGFSSFRHRRRFTLFELRDAVRTVSADIVFLQEVVGEHGEYSIRYDDWPAAPQYDFLAGSIWRGVAYGRNAVYQHGHHGNAVLSKYPILHYRNIDISAPSGDERRGLLYCVLMWDVRREPIHAVCVHLGLSRRHREVQVTTLCDLIRREVPEFAPLVIAGDFNDWDLNAHRRLTKDCGLQDVLSLRSGRPARTFPVFWPLLRLDRIYLRHLRLRSATVLSSNPWSHLSDHAAIVVDTCPP